MITTCLMSWTLFGILVLQAGTPAGEGSPFAVDAGGALGTLTRTWEAPRRVTVAGSVPAFDSGLATSFLSVNQDPEGDMPRAVVFTPDGATVLVVNRDTDSLAFFDVATQTVTDTVLVGDFPVAVAVTPDGSMAVVPNVLDDTVSLVDLSSRTLAATVSVTGSQPFAVEVTSDSSTAVVAVINDGISSSFSVIDLAAGTETSSFASSSQGVLGFFFSPEAGIFGNIFSQFVLAADDITVVLPDRPGGRVRLYDITTGSQTANLAVAAAPLAVDLHPDGSTAVVSHESGVRAISVIDVVNGTVLNSISTGALDLTGQIIRITPDKSHAIAAISNNVIFVNLTTGLTTATLSTGTVGDIELSFDGQYAFVSNFNSRLIDIATQTVVDTLSVAATADAAASPVEHRMVGLNNRFREDIHLYDTNGASGFVEAVVLSGEPAEGDAPRTVAVSPDGMTAVVANNTSRNVSILDLTTSSVRAWVDTGDRPLGVAITPDGTHAVVCNGDADTVSIIDLATDIRVANLSVPGRPAEVAISPDSQTAYVTSISGTDRVHFIDLAGAASSVSGSLIAGQMGSVGYTFNVVSGLALSPDGSLLAVCISFADELLLIDTGSQTELTRVTVGDFPIRVSIEPGGQTAYVANAFGDSVSVVDLAGAASSVSATVPGIEFPLVNVTGAAGDFHYVGNFDGNDPRLYVIDTALNSVATSVVLPSPARACTLSATDDSLYLATTGGEFVRVHTAGAASSILSTTGLTAGPPDMAYSQSQRVAVVPQPGADDGVDLVAVPPPWVDLGGGTVGINGQPTLDMSGPLTAGSDLNLQLTQAPAGALMLFRASLASIPLNAVGGTLYPNPFDLQLLLPADGSGEFSLIATVAPGAPARLDLYFQFIVQDLSVPHQITLSNAMRGSTP
jgi:YVTN family beta-propeller protein